MNTKTIILSIFLLTLPVSSVVLSANPGAVNPKPATALDSKCLPWPETIRTDCAIVHADNTGRIAEGNIDLGFRYFDDSSIFIYDGSLIIGTSAVDLDWSIHKVPPQECLVPPTNPGPFYRLGIMTGDSTSSDSYRLLSGQGTNHDSTIGFAVDYYAPKHADSCDFFIARFKIYKGSNNPGGMITNLTVAYACDWDIPTDTGSNNYGGVDQTRNMLYQRGVKNAPISEYYGAMSAFRFDHQPIVGGFVWDNPTHMYPNLDFVASDLWSQMEGLLVGRYNTTSLHTDLSSVLTIFRDATINGFKNDTLQFVVLFAAERAGALSGVKETSDKAFDFVNDHGIGSITPSNCCRHGDSNDDGAMSISDAVFTINYIFGGGARPATECQGDLNCDCAISISDVVSSLVFIFHGGPPPAACCPNCVYDW